jgi:hypothetical protein
MKFLAAGLTVAATLGGVSGAFAQTNNNLPFLRPQNGAQVQIPSGWPPGSGDVRARPPTSYTAPGTYAPFQGSSRGDRGVTGEPEPGMEQPRADTSDPLVGTPNRSWTKTRTPGSGGSNAGAGQRMQPDQDHPSQNNMGRQRPLEPDEVTVPKAIPLPKDPNERNARVFDLFKRTREVKPPPQHEDVPFAVGSRLPVSWVYMDVPETVSKSIPGYLGHVYTFVDGRYVVLDPATYKVVAIYTSG